MFEEQLHQSLLSFIEGEGYSHFVEIPLLMGSIDIVGIKGSECLVIETKIAKWKNALKQAIGYGYGAEKTYVAMPQPTARNVAEKHGATFEKYGVGIIEVSDIVNILLDCEDKTPSPVFKQIIFNEVQNRKQRRENRVLALRRRFEE